MAPAIPTTAPPETGAGFLQKAGFFALAGFVYCFVSRLLDVTFYSLHVPFVLAIVAGAAAVLTGRFITRIRSRIAFLYALLTGYFAAGVPFVFWRAGSFHMLRYIWVRAMLVWLLVVALTATYQECKTLLNAIAMGSFTAALLGLFFKGAETVEGRLVLVGGRFSNPNDYGLALLIGIPFLWRLYHNAGRPGLLRRLAILGAGVVTLISFFRTGSRAGLYTLGFVLILILLRVSLATKLKVGMIAVVALGSALVLMPSHLRNRYLTFATSDREAAASTTERTAVGFAADSTTVRRVLLRQSLEITLRHPIFGIGLGNFAAYVAQTNADMNIRDTTWLGTHNTYTQISSEAGIPALVIFIAILATSWRSLSRLIRATRGDSRPLARDIHATAHAMQICLGAFASFLVFFHFAYDMLPHLLVAVTLVLSRTAEAALAELAPPQDAPAPGPAFPRAMTRRAATVPL
jgi:O-antigen ligase